MEELNLESCTTNKQVTEAITKHVQSVPLKTVLSDLSKTTIFQEREIEALYVALATGKNAILYGTGGFGKTSIVKTVCEYFKIPVHVITGYEDMEPEKLLGLPNFDKLLNESDYVTAFEKSPFAKPGILILEEFLDARPATAASLKDVLSERGKREKDLLIESLISSVIICTNKNPEEESKETEIAALYMDRFPIRVNVEWDDFSISRYEEYINFKVKLRGLKMDETEMRVLAHMCALSCVQRVVSPRIVEDSIDVVHNLGLNYLHNLSGIDCSTLEQAMEESKKQEKSILEIQVLTDISKFLLELEEKIRKGKDLANIEAILLEIEDRMSVSVFDDSNFELYDSVTSLNGRLLEEVVQKTSNKIDKDDESKLNELFKGFCSYNAA